MNAPFEAIPFYFLRHGQTDHNVNQVYDDHTEIPLNLKGERQALDIQNILDHLPIATICSSPLLRVQQTKSILLGEKQVNDIVLDELRECPGNLWRMFLALEERALTEEEWRDIHTFIDRVKKGLEKAFSYPSPLLLIAHGGTYWALTHLLQIEGDRKIDNCILTYITPKETGGWYSQPVAIKGK